MLLSKRSLASVNYLVSSIPKPASVPVHQKKPKPKDLPPADASSLVYTPNDLNNYFRYKEYGKPSNAQLTKADSFFAKHTPKHEWTCAKYEDIPDIKINRLQNEHQEKLARIEPYQRTEYHDNLEKQRSTYGYSAEVLRPLPEILLLGHTNAGKSTMVNTLFKSERNKKEGHLAFVSRRAGFTKCLNSFNVGGKLRIIDSPGYGEYGEVKQGEVVLDYIRNRSLLRRVFLLVDSKIGFQEEDSMLIDTLVELGTPFEIIFTKVDEIVSREFPKFKIKSAKNDIDGRLGGFEMTREGNSKVLSYYNDLVNGTGLRDLASMPRLLFNNSQTNKLLTKKMGYREIRYAILESCSLIEAPQAVVNEDVVTSQANKERRKRTRRGIRV
ncbi:hypothetical protein FT663_02871 [Candidozyma haemuli var. vulneris]|uniref:EngB-type G domain-containing protein n=1 Tax=Candidozyma haemuli TaxID=45357 RepID=A0A2V1AWY0_9ASCO|nr:hypothetical protein CXQ85_005332 [[Candida] haemuloni]KAF3989573.1 hypothetical protein FT662_02743 [[Candida] haemuloni var. vulneris]KAF3991144.1 hypothetical protein FT663_02871 [[Candida] haemuloni var. vulneris]PVH22304.1 hypothetical protein CXQ85_005332 [[Candida] haemuloni]